MSKPPGVPAEEDDPPIPETLGCPECGSSRLTWRVRRAPNGNLLAFLVWSCKDCETTWLENITPQDKPVL